MHNDKGHKARKDIDSSKCSTFKSFLMSYVSALVVELEEKQVNSIFSKSYGGWRRWLLISLPVIYFAMIIYLLWLTWTSVYGSKTFIVNARTEYIEYLPKSLNPPRIHFFDAAIHYQEAGEDIYDPNQSTAKTEPLQVDSGSLEIQGKDEGKLRFEFFRIGTGPLRVLVKSDKSLSVYNNEDEKLKSLPPFLELVLKDPSLFIKNGLGWQYNLDGNIKIGRTPTFDVTQVNGLLLDGELQVVARKILNKNPYTIDLIKLKMGDEIKFTLKDLPSLVSGIVTFDDNRGLQLVAVVQADTAIVRKPRDIILEIENNLWSALQQDELLALFWAIVLFFPGVIALVARWAYLFNRSKDPRLA